LKEDIIKRTKPKMSQPERTAIQTKKTALQRAIYQWSIAQCELAPAIKRARMTDDFSFSPAARTSDLDEPGEPQPDPNAPPDSSTARPTGPRVGSVNDLMDVENVTDVNLWLPSDIPALRRLDVYPPQAIQVELQYRLATLHDALSAIRRHRRIFCTLRAHYKGVYKGTAKTVNVTRQRGEMHSVTARIDACRALYQAAWTAALRLDPFGSWQKTYRLLQTGDIRGPNPQDDATDVAAVKTTPRVRDMNVGKYITSWIWAAEEHDSSDHVRVHWAKMTANAERWEEERTLVPEEMRRTLAYLVWEMKWWEEQRRRRHGAVSSQLALALEAYAVRQIDIRGRRIDLFAREWLPILKSAGLGADWIGQYEIAHLAAEEAKTSRQSLAQSRRAESDARLMRVAVQAEAALTAAFPALPSVAGAIAANDSDDEDEPEWSDDEPESGVPA
jgi:hypothetical protein